MSHINNADETATIEIQVVCNNKRVSVRRLDTGENSVRMYLAASNQLNQIPVNIDPEFITHAEMLDSLKDELDD